MEEEIEKLRKEIRRKELLLVTYEIGFSLLLGILIVQKLGYL